MSETDTSGVIPPNGSAAPHKDRHEPRGRKPNDGLPPSRAREVQRAFRLRRAEHLAALEERINLLEAENSQLRALLSLPEADRGKIGSGPTGRGKALREGGVPMSERVRARKEARERERRAKGLIPDAESSDHPDDSRMRDSETLSPRASSSKPPNSSTSQVPNNPFQNDNRNGDAPNIDESIINALPLFGQPDANGPFNYQLPIPFSIPVSPGNTFPDFSTAGLESSIFKSDNSASYNSMLGMFDSPETSHTQFHNPSHSQHPNPHAPQHQTHQSSHSAHHLHASRSSSALEAPPVQRRSPPTPPISNPSSTPVQPDLLTRLKQCCHLSDSHVVNDPGLLIFATRLCQSFPCSFSGAHPDSIGISDSENLMLEDSWKALKAQLDPVGAEADGENRINTGRMAAELVCRAAHSRGTGFIVCRYREGMSIKRTMIKQLVQGLGGNMD